MGFSKADAARHSSARAGDDLRVTAVKIKAQVEAGRIAVHDLKTAARNFEHPQLINISHGEGRDTRITDELALNHVDIANPNQHNVIAIHRRVDV